MLRYSVKAINLLPLFSDLNQISWVKVATGNGIKDGTVYAVNLKICPKHSDNCCSFNMPKGKQLKGMKQRYQSHALGECQNHYFPSYVKDFGIILNRISDYYAPDGGHDWWTVDHIRFGRRGEKWEFVCANPNRERISINNVTESKHRPRMTLQCKTSGTFILECIDMFRCDMILKDTVQNCYL